MIHSRQYGTFVPYLFAPYRPNGKTEFPTEFGTSNYRLGFTPQGIHYVYWKVKAWRITMTFSGTIETGPGTYLEASGSVDEILNFYDGSSEGIDNTAPISQQERLSLMDGPDTPWRHACAKAGTWGDIRDQDGNLISNIITSLPIGFFWYANLSDTVQDMPVHYDTENDLYYPVFGMQIISGAMGDADTSRPIEIKDHSGNVISTGGLSGASDSWINSGIISVQAETLW